MITSAKLAGFFAAHSIWCVSDGETLIPLIGYQTADGQRNMERIDVEDNLEASVARGKEKLQSNEMQASDAVLLCDGYITVEGEKSDAILIEMRDYSSPRAEATIAVTYTPKSSGKFRVHKPKLLAWNNCDQFNLDAMWLAFFEGVNAHEKGAAVWNECLDESK